MGYIKWIKATNSSCPMHQILLSEFKEKLLGSRAMRFQELWISNGRLVFTLMRRIYSKWYMLYKDTCKQMKCVKILGLTEE